MLGHETVWKIENKEREKGQMKMYQLCSTFDNMERMKKTIQLCDTRTGKTYW